MINWGIVGTGYISSVMAKDFKYVTNGKLIAVSGTSEEKAKSFAHKYGITKYYGDLESLLADDEIDYSLYEPAHPLGSAYYDAAIKNMPVLEANPDETQVMKYKLVTLPKNTTRIPVVEFGVPNISVNQKKNLGHPSSC